MFDDNDNKHQSAHSNTQSHSHADSGSHENHVVEILGIGIGRKKKACVEQSKQFGKVVSRHGWKLALSHARAPDIIVRTLDPTGTDRASVTESIMHF